MPRRRLRATPRPSARARSTWVKSSTPDVDLQATISEVRPDGSETFVQNGWIRASERKLATNSNNIFQQAPTLLQPIPTFLASDVQPMPANQFEPVVIPLYFEGHVYRAGSRIRVMIAAPNGTQPVWAFGQTQPAGTTATESIALVEHAVEPDPPDRAWCQRSQGDAPVPEPAQRAVPPLPAVREQRFLTTAAAARSAALRRPG